MTKPNTSNLMRGETGDWEVVVGMEVHAQVTSKSKLFSGAATEFGGAPNSHVSPSPRASQKFLRAAIKNRIK